MNNKLAKTIVIALIPLVVLLNVARDQKRVSRFLSINLGGGACLWTPPEPLEKDLNTTTMIASYPGSGKRLAWHLLEALTGKVTGDDWDLSQNGYDSILTMKTTWPHPEGVWLWGDTMDQVILMVRNPRFAIPSYHTMKHELNWSQSWSYSFSRIPFTYTERSPVQGWNSWRDANFEREIENWCAYIDFWMEDGKKGNTTIIEDATGDVEQDWRCTGKNYTINCTPKALVQFEKLSSSNANTGQAEMTKMTDVLDASTNVNLIEPEARNCVFDEVLSRKEFYNPNRDGHGPPVSSKQFTADQLDIMRTRMEAVRDKYAAEPWTLQETAIGLVDALNTYISEVETEYEIMMELQASIEAALDE